MSDSIDPSLPPVFEQLGPPPLVEDLRDTDDFPEGESLPEQTPVPDASIYEVD